MHGCQGEGEVIYVGGRHDVLASRISAALAARGFSVGTHEDPGLQGTRRANVCNRGKLGMGVQFEITLPLRLRLADKQGQHQSPSLNDFVEAIAEGCSKLALQL